MDQNRFYIDRTAVTSMLPNSRAWVDLYRRDPKQGITHDKFLMLASCNDENPRVMFKRWVSYGAAGSTPALKGAGDDWLDVIPGTSQETMWRFTCHATPENAIAFAPDGPEEDARAFFSRSK
jgi:hypothetical protein